MGDNGQQLVERYAAAMTRRDVDALALLWAEDVIVECPQSSERICGRTHAWESERRATDTRPIETRRILGRGDLWVWEARLVGTDEVVHVVSILELAGDHIARVTEFFSHPLEADGV